MLDWFFLWLFVFRIQETQCVLNFLLQCFFKNLCGTKPLQVTPLKHDSCLKNRIYSSIAQLVERRTVNSAETVPYYKTPLKNPYKSTIYRQYLT